MNSIKVSLENCYGINKLSYEFIFEEDRRVFSVYSPNGVMKTSFAKTFDDISQGKESEDLVFSERETKRKITKDGGELAKEEVFVIHPYKEDINSDGSISTLLANKTLRDEHAKIHSNINRIKNELLKKLNSLAGLKDEYVAKEISKIFMQNQEDKFVEALESLKTRIEDKEESFKDIRYSTIFSERAITFWKDPVVQKNIADYVKKYDAVIEQSTYFKKGIFNHSQAEEIAKQLDQNGFFEAEHSILLKDNQNKISTQEKLKKVIDDEKNKILKSMESQKMFNDIDKKLVKNKEMKDLREYLSNHSYILSQLRNIESFKAKVWLSYLRQEKSLYLSFLEIYDRAKTDIARIIKQAQNEKTEWLKAVEIFSDRFYVPFKITIKNKIEVMLNNEIPTIAFEFKDRTESRPIQRDALLKVLSQGEKRALYILNIIFEIEARKQTRQETLFVVDDIADSFDYKNKYAIIEYLRDVSKEDYFYQIILTHNFDFHRTISSRLTMRRKNRLNTLKYRTDVNRTDVKFIEEVYQNNPFNDWINNFDNPKKLIASIPFVRNLAEFTGDNNNYDELTAIPAGG